MSDEERRDSLADQAAAWVPPWERPAPPKPAPIPADAPPDPDPDPEPTPADAAPTPAEQSRPEILDTSRPQGTGTLQDRDMAGGLGAGATAGGPAASTISGENGAGGVTGKRGRRRVAPAPEPAPELDDAELRGALEAILLVVDEPVSELTLAQVLEQRPERVGPMLDEIAAGYTAAGHGFELRRAAGGWRLYTRPEYAGYVERFVLDGQSVRLTQAALETLAVIAYKQPVTRSRISAIRGVNCDGVIRTLVLRGLVEECGAEPDSGAFLYRTTTMFLEKLGLNSVADLPPLAPFLPDDVEELADATR
ncbi:SMC-Scp complex subunit ScpB [Micromonospora sp. R77]|uniref:SMC-Scp complex subunit ScpB n=1 Tax=Micromonospora sp. R77 TaxID=2925836 RepID=UPI001F6020D0|nr:SMC-Scp complex subunit ScpB [Micromonospora sp. R77]MCI4065538.1 SMC-Scp complex subunit ScpB [Micromonospora sp. R77]